MGNNAPDGYLKCDGASYSTTTYATLANFFEAEFGSKYYFGGSGTLFNVPDLQGEFLRGTGTNSHTNSGNGGNVGEHQGATVMLNMQYSPTDNGTLAIARGAGDSGGSTNFDYPVGTSSMIKWTTSKSAGSKATESTNSNVNRGTVRPTNTSVLYCIKY